jgi:hypothetical protein
MFVVSETHRPLQSDVPAGHLHTPAWQLVPPLHALPHLPQSSVLV